MEKNTDFATQVEAIRSHTATYARDPAFRKDWLGLTTKSRNWRAQQLRVFAELVGSKTDSLAQWRILDVGCGDGRFLRALLEFDAQPSDLVGIDISDDRFEVGRAKNPLIKLLKTDGITIPYGNESFDLVTQWVCFSNIPTMKLRQQVADEISRVLKPGGFLFWWDSRFTNSPSDRHVDLQPADYFSWEMQKLAVSELPRPSECLRPIRGLRETLGPVLNLFAYKATHIAALIGPKPH